MCLCHMVPCPKSQTDGRLFITFLGKWSDAWLPPRSRRWNNVWYNTRQYFKDMVTRLEDHHDLTCQRAQSRTLYYVRGDKTENPQWHGKKWPRSQDHENKEPAFLPFVQSSDHLLWTTIMVITRNMNGLEGGANHSNSEATMRKPNNNPI